MSRVRKTDLSSEVADDIIVIFKPKFESTSDFAERTVEVKEILKKIILLSNKRGRPSVKEESYEKAA